MRWWVELLLVLSGITFVGFIGLIWKTANWYSTVNSAAQKCAICDLGPIRTDVAVIKKEMEIYFKQSATALIDIVRSHDHPERDTLLDKFDRDVINVDEASSLATILRNDLKESVEERDLRVAMALLLGLVERYIAVEAEANWKE